MKLILPGQSLDIQINFFVSSLLAIIHLRLKKDVVLLEKRLTRLNAGPSKSALQSFFFPLCSGSGKSFGGWSNSVQCSRTSCLSELLKPHSGSDLCIEQSAPASLVLVICHSVEERAGCCLEADALDSLLAHTSLPSSSSSSHHHHYMLSLCVLHLVCNFLKPWSLHPLSNLHKIMILDSRQTLGQATQSISRLSRMCRSKNLNESIIKFLLLIIINSCRTGILLTVNTSAERSTPFFTSTSLCSSGKSDLNTALEDEISVKGGITRGDVEKILGSHSSECVIFMRRGPCCPHQEDLDHA
ncbi:hypothetical protein Tco_0480933 [Tanacetum coccineum]|uniref:Uncharacterized protein n=1 Tax=Tanacetum coccineum TaxID=301880 RepID=A0ABQ5EIT4_9ASTR